MLYSNLSAIEYDNEAKADWNIATCLTIAHGDLGCATRKNSGDYCDNPNIFCRVLDEASGLNYTAVAYQRPSCRASGVPADCELEKSDAKQWLKTFPVGDFSNCWYNPDNPKMVALENDGDASWATGSLCWAGLLIFFCYCAPAMFVVYRCYSIHVHDKTEQHFMHHGTLDGLSESHLRRQKTISGLNRTYDAAATRTGQTISRVKSGLGFTSPADPAIEYSDQSTNQLLEKLKACENSKPLADILKALGDCVSRLSPAEVRFEENLQIDKLKKVMVQKKEVVGNEEWNRHCKVNNPIIHFLSPVLANQQCL